MALNDGKGESRAQIGRFRATFAGGLAGLFGKADRPVA